METIEKNAVAKVDDGLTARELRRARAHMEARFSVLVHLVAYLSINLLLYLINMATFAGAWWVLWPVFGWGVGLLCHAIVAFLVPGIANVRRRMYAQELERMRTRA